MTRLRKRVAELRILAANAHYKLDAFHFLLYFI